MSQLEFRQMFHQARWKAEIAHLGLEFVIQGVIKREKEVFDLTVVQWHSSVFNNTYKTYERATIKANALLKEYRAQDEEE